MDEFKTCPECLGYIDTNHDALLMRLANASLKFDITVAEALVMYMTAHHDLGHPSDGERERLQGLKIAEDLVTLAEEISKAMQDQQRARAES